MIGAGEVADTLIWIQINICNFKSSRKLLQGELRSLSINWLYNNDKLKKNSCSNKFWDSPEDHNQVQLTLDTLRAQIVSY